MLIQREGISSSFIERELDYIFRWLDKWDFRLELSDFSNEWLIKFFKEKWVLQEWEWIDFLVSFFDNISKEVWVDFRIVVSANKNAKRQKNPQVPMSEVKIAQKVISLFSYVELSEVRRSIDDLKTSVWDCVSSIISMWNSDLQTETLSRKFRLGKRWRKNGDDLEESLWEKIQRIHDDYANWPLSDKQNMVKNHTFPEAKLGYLWKADATREQERQKFYAWLKK